MAIKVVINYPKTEEEIQKLKERQSQALADAVLQILNNRLTPIQLDKLMSKL